MRPAPPHDLSTLSLGAAADGTTVPVHAQPGARREGIVGLHNGRLKIAVTQVAEQGKANEALCRVLAEFLGASRRSVTLASGATSRQKSLHVAGMGPDEVRARLAAALTAGQG